MPCSGECGGELRLPGDEATSAAMVLENQNSATANRRRRRALQVYNKTTGRRETEQKRREGSIQKQGDGQSSSIQTCAQGGSNRIANGAGRGQTLERTGCWASQHQRRCSEIDDRRWRKHQNGRWMGQAVARGSRRDQSTGTTTRLLRRLPVRWRQRWTRCRRWN